MLSSFIHKSIVLNRGNNRPVGRNFKARSFSDIKTLFNRNLTARHLAVLFFDLASRDLVQALKSVEGLGEVHGRDNEISLEVETRAYDAKKKFITIENRIVLL